MQTVMAASDSEADEIDENAIHDVEAGADLLESVYIYITEGKYQEFKGCQQIKRGQYERKQ